jgi:4-hydroxybenzoate polyprenyltransferase
MWSGAASAFGAGVGRGHSTTDLITFLILGSLVATLLNAASNVLNQIYDLDIDRINKPERPLPSEAISVRAASWYCFSLYFVSCALAYPIQPQGRLEVFWIVLATAVLTWLYSAPPIRARRFWWLAPLVIAVPRGGLLKVAGWGLLAPVFSDLEPWLLGLVFFLYVLGAASTKDFSDIEGDRKGRVVTLPIRFGAKTSALIMAPFYVLPWCLFLAFAIDWTGRGPFLHASSGPATLFGCALATLGFVQALSLVRTGDRLLLRREGQLAWRRLYLLMMVAQVGMAVLYLAFGTPEHP